MAYDQSYYQGPQRPYAGRAAQRPGPPQGYSQPPPQQHSSQQYDQYQDGYGYDDYNNGYDEYSGGQQEPYQDMNRGGRGNGYSSQDQGYSPQQEYYGNERGGLPPNRGGRGAPMPMQRQPMSDGERGGYDPRGGGQSRGYQNGSPGMNSGPLMGRGGRPAPLERGASSDPGMRLPRKPLKSPPMSPEGASWDNPFPTFPGAKKKTSISEVQRVQDGMAAMEIGGQPQNRPRTAGSRNQDRAPNSGRGPSLDGYGRPSGDSQRSSQSRGYPQQGPPNGAYQDPRRGPPGPVQGYGPPRQNEYRDPGYNDQGGYAQQGPPTTQDFGPPPRSMTTPNEQPRGMPSGRPPPAIMEGPGPSAPYNGPIGRGMPPRPSTATGSRPPPLRTYSNNGSMQAATPQQYQGPYGDYNNSNRAPNDVESRQARESIGDFYDAYYETSEPAPTSARRLSTGSEMPNFDTEMSPKAHRRGTSIDEHINPGIGMMAQDGNSMNSSAGNNYPQLKPAKSQPDFRAQAQPQAAVFDMVGDAPPLPQQNYQNEILPPQSNQYTGQPRNRGPPLGQQGYRAYDQGAPNNYDTPQRSTSSAPRPNDSGLPGGSLPRGLPNGPPRSFTGLPNGPSPNAVNRTNSMPTQPLPNPDALPSHPRPVRAGLIPNSVAANQANNKPIPVRNYNNTNPGAQSPLSNQSPTATPDTPQPVTQAELEQLKNAILVNPNDHATQLTLAKKLVEASDVLVATIPDQRARNKAREKYVLEAHKHLKKLVGYQNADAMFYLADCYGRGALGLETDNKEAFTLYQSAAKAGHAAAAYRTAVCCEIGNDEGGGTRKEPLKAIQWYKRAATLGDTPAMYKIGMILLKGLLGQDKNPREAIGWLKRAAERADAENPHALHELGLLYESPQLNDSSIVRDEAYSFSLFQDAANLGYKFSQFRLGAAYEYGLFDCPIDPRLSIMWYSRAAAQEEHQSELSLSGWYLTGSETPDGKVILQQSDTEAYLWARKAALAGLAKAEYAMGYFTEVGIGAPAKLEDAKRWYWRAAAQNFPKARERLEELKKGGSKQAPKTRERISRSKVGKQNEGECAVM